MKLLASFTFVLLVLSLSTVSAKIVVKSILKEVLPPQDTNAVERAGKQWLQQHESGENRRHLRPAAPHWCSSWCAGFPCGQCFIWLEDCWNCGRGGGRRDEESAPSDLETTMPHARELSPNSEECLKQIDEILLVMEDAVSEEGEPIVESSDFTCYEYFPEDEEDSDDEEDSETCEGLIGWNVWDATRDMPTKEGFEEFPAICQSEMRKSNIEAVVDTECDVGKVDFFITGPDSYSFKKTERQALYFLYGNRKDDIHRTYHPFPAGDYTVKVNIQLKNKETIERSLGFIVEDC